MHRHDYVRELNEVVWTQELQMWTNTGICGNDDSNTVPLCYWSDFLKWNNFKQKI